MCMVRSRSRFARTHRRPDNVEPKVLLVATTDQDVRLARGRLLLVRRVKGDQKPDLPSRMIVTLDHLTNC